MSRNFENFFKKLYLLSAIVYNDEYMFIYTVFVRRARQKRWRNI
jgi:hypothetical protein